MTKVKKKSKFVVWGLFVLFLFSFLSGLNFWQARAETTVYSNVLEDLQKDENFNLEDYPQVEDDYSLKVIQIAESSSGELFIYVYQPCSDKELHATSISISTGIEDNASWKLYNLTLLNSNGTLGKYLVNDFKVLKDALRYYDITEIYRKWNEKYDKATGNDNTISEVPFIVSQRWTASTVNGEVSYNSVETETIHITDKYVGSVRYSSGIFWAISYDVDSHYVAFSTDLEIDNLIEADVFYVSTPICASYGLTGWSYVHNSTYGVASEHYITITEDDVMTNDSSWLGHKKFVKDRIQSVQEFVSQETLSDSVKNNLKGKQWVLRFFESKYYDKGSYYYWTEVNDVSILRLKFQTAGKTYNLGVVDNKQSGDNIPDNIQEKWWDKALQILKYTFYAILGVIIVVLLAMFTPVFKLLFTGLVYVVKYLFIGIGYLFKGLWWLIKTPFTLFFD